MTAKNINFKEISTALAIAFLKQVNSRCHRMFSASPRHRRPLSYTQITNALPPLVFREQFHSAMQLPQFALIYWQSNYRTIIESIGFSADWSELVRFSHGSLQTRSLAHILPDQHYSMHSYAPHLHNIHNRPSERAIWTGLPPPD